MAKQSSPWYRKSKNCWYVWHDGRQVRLARDEPEAIRLWHLLLAGALPQSAPKPEPAPVSSLTVAELIDAYLADASLRLKPSTLASKRKVLNRLKVDRGQEPALTLKPVVVSAWLGKQTGWGQSRRWLAAGIVKACYRWAVSPAQLLPSDPTAGLKLPSPRSRGADTLVGGEVHARLLSVAPSQYRDALQALHGTGCRPGELCQVEARHFDARAAVWILDIHKTDRTGKVRVIHLPPAVVELCKTLAQRYPTGPIFRQCNGKALTPERLRNWLFKTRRRLGLGRVIAYGYRHGLATDALAAGVPDAQVAALLGHSSTTMLHRHYSHLTARARVLQDALDKVRGQEGQP